MNWWALLAQGLGKAAKTGINQYNELQRLDIDREQNRIANRRDKFNRLMTLSQSGQNMAQGYGDWQRLQAIRNGR